MYTFGFCFCFCLVFRFCFSQIELDIRGTIEKSQVRNFQAEALDQEEVKEYITSALSLIDKCTISELLNVTFLEQDLIPKLGLNDEYLNEFPPHLFPYTGKGIRAWQYPNQFAKYLLYLSSLPNIHNYLEIGVRFGGTFMIIHEYLKKLKKPLQFSVAVDLIPTNHMYAYVQNFTTTYTEYHLHHHPDYAGRELTFDLCFIDGDHTFEGVQSDFLLVKNICRYISFHDVDNDKATGSRDFWKIMKLTHPERYYYEIIDQYPEVIAANNGFHYLGFGILHNLP